MCIYIYIYIYIGGGVDDGDDVAADQHDPCILAAAGAPILRSCYSMLYCAII